MYPASGGDYVQCGTLPVLDSLHGGLTRNFAELPVFGVSGDDGRTPSEHEWTPEISTQIEPWRHVEASSFAALVGDRS